MIRSGFGTEQEIDNLDEASLTYRVTTVVSGCLLCPFSYGYVKTGCKGCVLEASKIAGKLTQQETSPSRHC